MKLWWLNLQSNLCTFESLKSRHCIAIGWSELGDLEKQITAKSYSERRFKSYIQLKGDLVYARKPRWRSNERAFDKVPNVFTQLLAIEKGDLIVAIETGNQKALGRPVILGIAQAPENSGESYFYDDKFDYAHCVCPNIQWIDWQRSTMGELRFPNISFNTLCIESSQLDIALDGLQRAGINTLPAHY